MYRCPVDQVLVSPPRDTVEEETSRPTKDLLRAPACGRTGRGEFDLKVEPFPSASTLPIHDLMRPISHQRNNDVHRLHSAEIYRGLLWFFESDEH